MHVLFTNDSLEGKPNKAFYVKMKLKDKSLVFRADTTFRRRLTPTQFFERNMQPLIVVNCTFFSPSSRNLNVVINRGMLLSYNVPSIFDKTDSLYHYVTRSAIGIDRRRRAEVVWVYTDTIHNQTHRMASPSTSAGKNQYPTMSQLERGASCSPCLSKWKVETAVGGGPNLLSAGEVDIANEQERMFAGIRINEKHPRTAMGCTQDGHLIILVIEGRFPGTSEGATLLQEATILKDLGCFEALNLDGGGSSCMLINGKQTITPSDKAGQRPIPAVFLVNKLP